MNSRLRALGLVLCFAFPIGGGRAAEIKPEASGAFVYRGIKGWCWTPDQYLTEIPTLRALHLNFLMNCYGSMFTSGPGQPWTNEWWKPMSEARKTAYARVIHECQTNDITFCFALHPQIASVHPLRTGNKEDFEKFFQHYAWAQSQGVHWFSVSLDDVGWGSGGPAAGGQAHARFVNEVLSRLRRRDAGAQMIFCPVPYWGDGTKPDHRDYLEALGRELQPDVYVFWTGDKVAGARITRRAAESYKKIVNHRLFLWDNYPVNDANPTLNLGALSGRDPELCQVIDGYISNPMATQNEINRIPLATCADYACNPSGYEPAASLRRAIARLCTTDGQLQVLGALVAAYPGFLAAGGGTGTNPVREKFKLALKSHETGVVNQLLSETKANLAGLQREFPNQFAATKATLKAEVTWMTAQIPAPVQ